MGVDPADKGRDLFVPYYEERNEVLWPNYSLYVLHEDSAPKKEGMR